MIVVISLCHHPLFRQLAALGLDTRDYVVFGSAPMFAHNLTERLHDLDVVARGEALRYAETHGVPGTGSVTGDRLWKLCDGRIEVSERWVSPEWDTDDLISRAELIDGIPFAPLSDVLKYKLMLRRAKDGEDIRALYRRTGAPTPPAE